MFHVERFCIRTYTLYVVLYLLSCSASNNLEVTVTGRIRPEIAPSNTRKAAHAQIEILTYV